MHDEFLIVVAAGNDGWHYECVDPAGKMADTSAEDLGCIDIGFEGIYEVSSGKSHKFCVFVIICNIAPLTHRAFLHVAE